MKGLVGRPCQTIDFVVRPERFELPAFWFVARRSIQLSYGRMPCEDGTLSM